MKRFIYILSLLLLFSSCKQEKTNNESSFVMDSSSLKETNTWHGIIDGKSGEGSLFFRLIFKENGIINIEKQYGGNNVIENKQWRFNDNKIVITGDSNDIIKNFDNATLSFKNDKIITFKNDFYQGKFQPYNDTISYIHYIIVLLILLLLNELFRRYKYPAIIFYFVLPIVLIPLWANHGVSYWFKWVKLYSVVFAAVWFSLMRYTKMGMKNYAKFIAMAFLAINIAEAVKQDFSMGYLPNVLNAVAGILSIITLYGWKGIHIENSKERDMVWPAMTTFWIIAYDIWNFVFVYLNFPGSAATQFLVLLSCTIPSLLIKKGTWLQARAFTLAAWFMYYFTATQFIEANSIPLARNDNLMLWAGIISFAANGIYAIIHFNKVFFLKKEKPILA